MKKRFCAILLMLCTLLTGCNSVSLVPDPPSSQTSSQAKPSAIEIPYCVNDNPYNTFSAMDDQYTYYQTPTGLYKIGHNKTTPILLDKTLNGTQVAVTDTAIYYISHGGLKLMHKADSKIETLIEQSSWTVTGVKIANQQAYVTLETMDHNEATITTKQYEIDPKTNLLTNETTVKDVPFTDGWIYTSDRINESEYAFYQSKLDGTEKEQLFIGTKLCLITPKGLVYQTMDTKLYWYDYQTRESKEFYIISDSAPVKNTMQFINYDDNGLYFKAKSKVDESYSLYAMRYDEMKLFRFDNGIVPNSQTDTINGWVYTYTNDGMVRFRADGSGEATIFP